MDLRLKRLCSQSNAVKAPRTSRCPLSRQPTRRPDMIMVDCPKLATASSTSLRSSPKSTRDLTMLFRPHCCHKLLRGIVADPEPASTDDASIMGPMGHGKAQGLDCTCSHQKGEWGESSTTKPADQPKRLQIPTPSGLRHRPRCIISKPTSNSLVLPCNSRLED